MKEQTFIVRVKYSRNRSLQGEIEWVQKKEKQSFWSAMELLKLMNDACKDNGNGEQLSEWDCRKEKTVQTEIKIQAD